MIFELRGELAARVRPWGFAEYVCKHVRAGDVLQFDVALAHVVRQEVMPKVNYLAALGGSCVPGDSDGGLFVY